MPEVNGVNYYRSYTIEGTTISFLKCCNEPYIEINRYYNPYDSRLVVRVICKNCLTSSGYCHNMTIAALQFNNYVTYPQLSSDISEIYNNFE